MARPQRHLEAGTAATPAHSPRSTRRLLRLPRRLSPAWRRVSIGGGILLALLLIAVALSFLIDEPLRRYIEGQMNARLDGYTVRIGRADFHPIGLGIDFEDLVVTQNAHPDPPVARIPELSASVQWLALLRGRIVGDFGVRSPVIRIDRQHLKREVEDPKPVTQRDWQDALQAMYPLDINLFRVWDGQLTYIDEGPDARPLRLTQVYVRTGNIRNIESSERLYPSHLRVEAVVFGNGKLLIDGKADFLAEPHLGVLAKIHLENIELDYFKPILARQNFVLRRGAVSAVGDIEYSPSLKALHLDDAVVRGLDGDYVHTPRSGAKEEKAAAITARKAEEVANEPEIDLRVDRFRVENARVGFVNRATNSPYRVFLDDTQLTITNFSNHFANGTGKATLRARFMGAGAMAATGTFRPEREGPDFDLDVRSEEHTSEVQSLRLLVCRLLLDNKET